MTTGMLEHFPQKDLIVLLLGKLIGELKHFQEAEIYPEVYTVDLMLLESEIDVISYWRRLGVCVWQDDAGGPDPEDWRDMKDCLVKSNSCLTFLWDK